VSPRRSQPKRGGKSTFAVPGDIASPDSFAALAHDWLEWLGSHGYSYMTLVDHSYWLARFAAWAELRGVHRPADVTLQVLEAYQRHVSLLRKPDGSPLSWATQSRALVALRAFFSWCRKTKRLLSNPAAELVMPRQSHKLPSATLSHKEAEAVLSVPDTGTVIGLRDRSVMELLGSLTLSTAPSV
jgi:integrase/recombinase XerD